MQIGRCRNKVEGKDFSFTVMPLQADGTPTVVLWEGRPKKSVYRLAKHMKMTVEDFTVHFDILMVST